VKKLTDIMFAYPTWRDGAGHDARAKMLIYAYGRKELPTQLYRAGVSQPVRPSENFLLYFAEMPANDGLLRFDRQVIASTIGTANKGRFTGNFRQKLPVLRICAWLLREQSKT
jgi:hypothetical protein